MCNVYGSLYTVYRIGIQNEQIRKQRKTEIESTGNRLSLLIPLIELRATIDRQQIAVVMEIEIRRESRIVLQTTTIS
jgi:hypothetical protein